MLKQQSTTSKALFGLSILILIFGIIQLSLSLSVSHKAPAEKAKAQTEVTYPWPYDGTNTTIAYYPSNYYPYSFLTSVSDAITAIAALALVSGALGLFFTFKPEFGWLPLGFWPFLHTSLQSVAALTVFVLLIASWEKHYSSSRLALNERGHLSGEYSYESYACQMRRGFDGVGPRDWMGRYCGMAVTARAFSVPVCLLLIAIAAMSGIQMKKANASAKAIEMGDLRAAEKQANLERRSLQGD
ncbi:hypothetical protein CBER1_05061 [Cercospora berteroae]|uniref:Uncharacterized protein n=1 Tax=Cercospora berteroae TaxID=357750 RepID=A0A2S6BRJ0_9PEZI|nr:hypothetical protein CBER1_05061 [Cercospora berteroae]